jgi:hypothetical protein
VRNVTAGDKQILAASAAAAATHIWPTHGCHYLQLTEPQLLGPMSKVLRTIFCMCGIVVSQAGLNADDSSEGDDPLAGGSNSSILKITNPQLPAYESLYAPDLLLAVLSEPHVDVLQQWLPLSDALTVAAMDELRVQARLGHAAAAAAFPASLTGQQQQQQQSGGLPLQPELAAAAGSADRQITTLLQVQGYAAAGQQLMMIWRQGDGSGSGSGACLVGHLKQLLPPLVTVTAAAAAADKGEGTGVDAAGGMADGQTAAAAAATATRGAAAVAGVAPPWGKDVDPTAAVGLIAAKYELSAALGALNLLTMLLKGPPDSVRQLAAAAADHPSERAALKPGLNPAAPSNPNAVLGQGGNADLGVGSGAVGCSPDGFGVQVLVTEVLEAGVLDVLQQGLRAGTCALEASSSDILWGLRGGDAMVR